ncbi:zinc metalloprotease HtpX [Halorutilales archaeon Cl-col2-1]
MDWKTDWSLRLRMLFTMGLLGVVYLVFIAVLATYGVGFVGIILVMGLFMLGQYFYSDKIALYGAGATKVDREEAPELHEMVDRLSQQADVPKPDVALIDSKVPNAFATGRSPKHSTVAVTTGLMNTLDSDEITGVLAHELSHVKNRDVAVMTIASFISTLAFMVVRWSPFMAMGRDNRQGGGGVMVALAASVVVWIVSTLLLRALSRYREFAADRGAARITGSPSALASALMKIDGRMDRVPERDLRQEESSMNAFYIIPVKTGIISRLLSTHPPTEKRIERLRELESQM